MASKIQNSRRNKSTYEWIDGSKVMQAFWANSQPDGLSMCVFSNAKEEWEDEDCHIEMPYACYSKGYMFIAFFWFCLNILFYNVIKLILNWKSHILALCTEQYLMALTEQYRMALNWLLWNAKKVSCRTFTIGVDQIEWFLIKFWEKIYCAMRIAEKSTYF